MADKFTLTKDKAQAARAHFQAHGWVVVPDFLLVDVAYRWYTRLLGAEMADEWWHACQVHDTRHTLYVQDVPRNMARVAANRAAASVPSRHDMVRYSLVRTVDESPGRNWLVEEVVNFFRSAEFLRAAADITGLPVAQLEAAFATKMVTGDFLAPHTDVGKPARQASFHLNLTPKWEAGWGGTLVVGDTAVPAPYNSLVLVGLHPRGRVTHTTMVTADTNHCRVGVFGWLQSGAA